MSLHVPRPAAPRKHTPNQRENDAAPQIEDVQVKTVDRSAHLAAIAGEHELKHAETVDKSAPVIPADVSVGKNPLPAVLAAIKKADE